MKSVTVIYAAPDLIWSKAITLENESTVDQAIQLSGFLDSFKDYKLELLHCGIFGKSVALSDSPKEGDRIEIYRGLVFDPKQSRRRRAIHRQKARHIKKKVPINDVTT